MEIKFNSYFSGSGLMDIGLMQSGITIGKAFEIDKAAVKTYKHNLGDHIKHCDLTQETVLNQNDCDGMVFTYPCTRYSTISDIHGTRTGDELYLHALRHMVVGNPEVFVVENVPGMKVFPVVMEAMTKLPNYHIKTYCPLKSEKWLPQRRNRLIIIGTKKRFNFREPIVSKTTTLRDIVESDPDVTLPKAIAARMNGEYRDLPIISDPSKGDIAPCAVAHYAKDKSTRLLVDKRFPMGVRPYSVREFARLQGVPDWFEFPVSNTDAYKQIGNGVPIPFGEWVGSELKRYFQQ